MPRSLSDIALRCALVAGAALCCAIWPPVVGLRAQLGPGLALVALGGVSALWPARRRGGRWLRWSGAALLWLVVGWCVFSQAAPLTQPLSLVWGLRGIPVVLAAGFWLWPQLSLLWLRRALAALVLPTLASLALVAWASPPRPLDFQPYSVAVDNRGTVYVSDAQSPVIRVFDPAGGLRAKVRPGLASRQGPPGPGASPPGPYNDPDGLGVPRATPGTGVVSGGLKPFPPGTDDFWFCGLAADRHDRLYVPDWMRGRMLRFAPDGHLEARWALPPGYQPSLGCVATAGDEVVLSDARGAVLRLNAAGAVQARWRLPEPIVGGISVAPDGAALYALARTRVYRLDLPTGIWHSWPLPVPTGSLGQPYQAILALSGDRVAIANLAARRLDLYRGSDGRAEAHWGGPGAWPGQFGQVGGLARDAAGHVYVADVDHRALQRFAPGGQVDGLYRSPDDDEPD